MMFYSKLTKELKKQFKTSDIPIPETRAKCVAIAQHVQESLCRLKEKKSFESYKGSREKDKCSSKYLQTDSRRDWKDRYYLGYYYKNNQNKEKTRPTSEKKQLVCYKCNKLGYYTTSCSNQKELTKKAKIQSI